MDLGRRAGGNRVRRELVLGVLLDLAPARDILLMLVERLGEGVAAGAVGDEEQVRGMGGIGDRLHRRLAGIGRSARAASLR